MSDEDNPSEEGSIDHVIIHNQKCGPYLYNHALYGIGLWVEFV